MIRTAKSVGGVVTNYVVNGTQVLAATTNNATQYYHYNSNGQLMSINYNGVEYGVVRNGQNDVIALIDGSGDVVVEYSYSSYGEILSITGSMAATLGNDNPFRYRGYWYDNESGFYYLQSRYNDPQVGRFINTDDTAILSMTQGTILGANLFAYCENNPVNNSDPSGYFWERAIVAAASGAIFGLIAYNIGKAVGLSGKTLAIFTATFVALGITIGAILGVQILARIKQLIKPVIHYFSNPGKVYFGLKILNFIQFEIHNPHHNKPIHFVVRLFISGGQKVWEWWFGK